MNFNPIGYLESCYKQKFGTPRQSGLVEGARSILKIEPSYQPEISLLGLSEFTHVWVIFVFHDLKEYSFHAKVHPPRLNGESVGLFATRSPHRPNPIGLSLVRLGEIKNNTIELWGGDFVEGTPVLDIKPYLKEIESIPTARSGWADGLDHFVQNYKVTYAPEAQAMIEKISFDFEPPLKDRSPSIDLSSKNIETTAISPSDHFRNVLEKTILLDPRPEVYKSLSKQHILRLWSWDVFFTMNDGEIHILKVIRI